MYTYQIQYVCGGRTYTAETAHNSHFKIIEKQAAGSVSADIFAYRPIKIKKFQLVLPYDFSGAQAVFVNGYQSWTESREYRTNEKMDGFTRLKEMIVKSPFNKNSGMGRAGDAFFL